MTGGGGGEKRERTRPGSRGGGRRAGRRGGGGGGRGPPPPPPPPPPLLPPNLANPHPTPPPPPALSLASLTPLLDSLAVLADRVAFPCVICLDLVARQRPAKGGRSQRRNEAFGRGKRRTGEDERERRAHVPKEVRGGRSLLEQ